MNLWYPETRIDEHSDRKSLTLHSLTLRGFGTIITYDLNIDYAIWEPGQYHVADQTRVYLLPIYKGNQATVCLVLRRVDEGKQIYERIGILMDKDRLPKDYVDEGGETRSCWEQRTITLV
jgi:hypothetical protein